MAKSKLKTWKDTPWHDLPSQVDAIKENIKALGTIEDAALTAVPGTFANLAAVQTYLDTVVGEIETKLNEIVANLKG